MGWRRAEPGWASPLGERLTGDDALSAPPREQEEDDQGKGKERQGKGKGTDYTWRGQVDGPSGPCPGRPASGPSGLYPWRGHLEDGAEPAEQAASAGPGHEPDGTPAWQALPGGPHDTADLVIVHGDEVTLPTMSSLPGLRPYYTGMHQRRHLRAMQRFPPQHRVHLAETRGHPAHLLLWPVYGGGPRPQVSILQKSSPTCSEVQDPGRGNDGCHTRRHLRRRHPGWHTHLPGPPGLSTQYWKRGPSAQSRLVQGHWPCDPGPPSRRRRLSSSCYRAVLRRQAPCPGSPSIGERCPLLSPRPVRQPGAPLPHHRQELPRPLRRTPRRPRRLPGRPPEPPRTSLRGPPGDPLPGEEPPDDDQHSLLPEDRRLEPTPPRRLPPDPNDPSQGRAVCRVWAVFSLEYTCSDALLIFKIILLFYFIFIFVSAFFKFSIRSSHTLHHTHTQTTAAYQPYICDLFPKSSRRLVIALGSNTVTCSRQCPLGTAFILCFNAMYKCSTSSTNQPTNFKNSVIQRPWVQVERLSSGVRLCSRRSFVMFSPWSFVRLWLRHGCLLLVQFEVSLRGCS